MLIVSPSLSNDFTLDLYVLPTKPSLKIRVVILGTLFGSGAGVGVGVEAGVGEEVGVGTSGVRVGLGSPVGSGDEVGSPVGMGVGDVIGGVMGVAGTCDGIFGLNVKSNATGNERRRIVKETRDIR